MTCTGRCAAAARDINLVSDIFAFDVRTGAVRRVSTGRASWSEPSINPAVDGIGAVIAFSSRHPRDSRDDGDDYDLFVRLPAEASAEDGPARSTLAKRRGEQRDR